LYDLFPRSLRIWVFGNFQDLRNRVINGILWVTKKEINGLLSKNQVSKYHLQKTQIFSDWSFVLIFVLRFSVKNQPLVLSALQCGQWRPLWVLSDWGNCDIQDPGPLLTVFEIKVILYVFLCLKIWLLFWIKFPSTFAYFKKVLPAALLISSSYPLSGKAPSSRKEGPHNFIPLGKVYNNKYYGITINTHSSLFTQYECRVFLFVQEWKKLERHLYHAEAHPIDSLQIWVFRERLN